MPPSLTKMVAQMITTTSPRANAGDIARALERRTEEVAFGLLGEPSHNTRREQRWGRHGSLSLCRFGEKRGQWYDHERGEGGDLLDLIARERNVTLRQAIAMASDMLGDVGMPAARPARAEKQQDVCDRIGIALQLWRQSGSISGTAGERYFVERRRLPIGSLPLDHALRWNRRIGAVVGLMTDPVSGKPIGIHRTFLDSEGAKRDRRMLGRQGVVRLTPDESVAGGLGLTEGVEDALAVLLSGWSPVWAATSAGAVARFPVLLGIDTLTIFADADDAGLRAAQACCDRWRTAGRDAIVASPRGPA